MGSVLKSYFSHITPFFNNIGLHLGNSEASSEITLQWLLQLGY